MSYLTWNEEKEIGKLTPEQIKVLNEAADKKRFKNWNLGILFVYGFGACFFFICGLLFLGTYDYTALSCFGLTFLGAIAFTVHAATYLRTLRMYEPEALKELF